MSRNKRDDKGRAFALIQGGRIGEARQLLAKFCARTPRDAELQFALGVAEGMLGNLAAAVSALRTVVALAPNHAAAHFNLGKALQGLGELEQAVASYSEACRLQPNAAASHNNLGNVLNEQGYGRQARVHLERATALEPGNATYCYNLGNILRDLGLREQAVAAYARAVSLDPDLADAQSSLGNARLALGDVDAALATYDRLLARIPAHSGALAGKAAVLNKQGRFDAAMQLIAGPIAAENVDAGIAVTYASFAHHVDRVADAVSLLERLLRNSRLGGRERARLNFALADLYDRTDRYDEAFACYERGNALRRRSYDSVGQQELFSRLAIIFSRAFMDSAPRASNGSDLPVFIVGMPRSGTSLVEQILASHPEVHGAGELSLLGQVAESAQERIDASGNASRALHALLAESADELAARYLAPLTALDPAARRITDKMPANFVHLGLIDLLLPKARIIHCRRDPLDTCLSCYFQDFSGDHPYANDLASLGEYHVGYARLMQHWKSVLRIPLLEVDYETLVTRSKTTIREMVRFCGLEWDDACLAFHANRRTVVTASYDQVRQPMYTRSIGRWRNYEKYIGALKAALWL